MISLLGMRCMLLGYSLEPSPKSRALGTAGSFITIGLSIMAHTRKTGLTRPEVLALTRFKQSLIFSSSIKKTEAGSTRECL